MNKIRYKFTPFPLVLVLSALLLLSGSSAAWYVRHLYQDLSTVLESNVSSVRAAEELEIVLREVRTRLNRALLDGSKSDLKAVLALQGETERWLAEAVRLATTPKEIVIMKRVVEGHKAFTQELESLTRENNRAQSMLRLKHLTEDLLTKEIIKPAHEYLDFNEETMVAVARQHRVLSQRFSWLLLVTGISGSFGGFFAGLQAARRMRRSIIELNLPLSIAADKLSEVAGPMRLSTFLDFKELKRVLETIAIEIDQVVERLQKSQEDVLKSEKLAAIGQLAAGTAHEIRNPLMSIKILVQAALRQETVERLSRDDLELIEREISRVELTVRNLLDFAKPPSLNRKTFFIRDLVNYCFALVSSRAAIQGVRLEKTIDDEHLRTEADFEQLHQVILNLLLNSLDAMPEGGELFLRVEELPEGAKSLEFRVEDSGQGIPQDLLHRIFEPFTSSKDSGTGLGLSISKRIIEAHSGKMFARNRETRGSVVGFRLPLVPLQTFEG